jgi:hypothetical protein
VIDIGVNLALLYMLDKEYKNAYKIYQILSTINDHVALTDQIQKTTKLHSLLHKFLIKPFSLSISFQA